MISSSNIHQQFKNHPLFIEILDPSSLELLEHCNAIHISEILHHEDVSDIIEHFTITFVSRTYSVYSNYNIYIYNSYNEGGKLN